MFITKTRYVSAAQCVRRFWLETHQPALAASPTLAEQRLMQQGTAVGALARTCFPGGILIEQSGARAVAATQTALQARRQVIYEATFRYLDCLVRCDVMVCEADGTWSIVEVKSSTVVHREHLHDLAVQRYVVEHAGVRVGRVKLMFINRATCHYPELRNFFVSEDVTEQVNGVLPEVEQRLSVMRALQTLAGEPDTAVGLRCQQPATCPFRDRCWSALPAVSVYTIPKLDWAVKQRLAAQGIIDLADLPADLALTEPQRAYVRLMGSGATEIDVPAIAQRLQTLCYPIHFFDFETDAPAIPRFAGMRPYQAFPFQYSCHVLQANGHLAHHEYLHVDSHDPRRPLVESLLQHIGPVGSVVVYFAPYERSMLAALGEALPEYAAPLQAISDRLWDQFEIFRDHYHSAAFQGSNSLKHVLPAVVPHLSYQSLAVRKGDQAQAVWAAMVEDSDSERKGRVAGELKEYCGLDTYAMVELHRVLKNLVVGQQSG